MFFLDIDFECFSFCYENRYSFHSTFYLSNIFFFFFFFIYMGVRYRSFRLLVSSLSSSYICIKKKAGDFEEIKSARYKQPRSKS